MSEDKRDINLDELEKANGGYIVDGFLRPDGTLEKVTTHTCPDCGAIFYSEGALDWHMQTAHWNNVV